MWRDGVERTPESAPENVNSRLLAQLIQHRPACRLRCMLSESRGDVILGFRVPPALAKKKQRRAQQIGKRIDDPIALAGIVQPLDEPLGDPSAFHDLSQEHGPRFPGQPFGPGFDAKGLVERGPEQR